MDAKRSVAKIEPTSPPLTMRERITAGHKRKRGGRDLLEYRRPAVAVDKHTAKHLANGVTHIAKRENRTESGRQVVVRRQVMEEFV